MLRVPILLLALACTPTLGLAQSAAPPPIRGGGVTVTPERKAPAPPDGDGRSAAQRYEDHAAFNKCVLRMQDREDDFSRPGLSADPLAYCQEKLGMTNADSVPDKKRAN